MFLYCIKRIICIGQTLRWHEVLEQRGHCICEACRMLAKRIPWIWYVYLIYKLFICIMLVLSDETNKIALSLAERGESGGENGDQKETQRRLAQQRERK